MTMTADTYVSRVLDALPRATPRREQIATELRGHIAERRAAGQVEADVLRQLGDPVALAESYLTAVPLVSASFGSRAAAKLIDAFAVSGFVALIGLMVWLLWPLSAELTPFLILAGVVGASFLFAIYTIVAEAQVGQTIGKRWLGIRVVRESGTRISVGQSIVRQLPLMLEVFLLDIMFALFTEKSQRAFELLSKTRVVVA